ncbi:hypothetical protein VPH35_088337 [Triticum aestivum]
MVQDGGRAQVPAALRLLAWWSRRTTSAGAGADGRLSPCCSPVICGRWFVAGRYRQSVVELHREKSFLRRIQRRRHLLASHTSLEASLLCGALPLSPWPWLLRETQIRGIGR